MSERAPFEVRGYRPGDEHAILAAFNRAFAAADPHFRPRELATWRWLYERNPSGARMSLAVAADGAVLAQYAGVVQRVLVDGALANFSQSVDSFADPTRSRGLARALAFVRAGEAFARDFGGRGPERDVVMWGLPIPGAWRIGHARLGYEIVRTLVALEARPGAAPAGDPDRDAAVESDRFPPEIDELFARFAAGRRAIAVRDRAQLDWRFREQPQRRYRIALVREAGRLAGCAVYRSGAFEGEPAGLVCDWIVPGGEDRAARALHGWLARAARAEGMPHLVALLPDTSAEWLAFQEAGFRARATRYALVGRSYVREIDDDWLRRHWWWTLGDTDLA